MDGNDNIIAQLFITNLNDKISNRLYDCNQTKHNTTLLDVVTKICCSDTLPYDDTMEIMESLAQAVFDDHSFMEYAITSFKLASSPCNTLKVIERCCCCCHNANNGILNNKSSLYTCICSVVDVYFTLPHTNCYYCYSTGKKVNMTNSAEGFAIRAVTQSIEFKWPYNFVFAVKPTSLVIHFDKIHPHIINNCLFLTNDMINMISGTRQCVLFRHFIWSWMINIHIPNTIAGRYSCGSIGEKSRDVLKKYININIHNEMDTKRVKINTSHNLLLCNQLMLSSDIFKMRAHFLPPCIAIQFDQCYSEKNIISDHHPKYHMRKLILSFLLRVYDRDTGFAIWKNAFFGDKLSNSPNFENSAKYGNPAIEDTLKCINKNRAWGCHHGIDKKICPFVNTCFTDVIINVENNRVRHGGKSSHLHDINTCFHIHPNNDIIASCKEHCSNYLRWVSNKQHARVISPLSYCYYMGI